MLAPQIFELWERPGEAGDKPSHYVKCIYNHNDLSLAHHPNGMCSSPVSLPMMSQLSDSAQHRLSCKELEQGLAV